MVGGLGAGTASPLNVSLLDRRGPAGHARALGTPTRLLLTQHWLFLLLTLSACHRQAPVSGATAESAVMFTQAFYKWYVPQGAHFEAAIRDSAGLFAPELLTALRADLEAQARNADEVVGLDWDPFLASQDPCESYRVARATRQGDAFLVDVYGVCRGATRSLAPDTPDVIAELATRDGSWVFVNFRYPREATDLVTTLARLRGARDSSRLHKH